MRRELSADGLRFAAVSIGDRAYTMPALIAGLEARARDDARDGFPAGGDGTRSSGTVRPTEIAAVANYSHPAMKLADDLAQLLQTVRQSFERAEDDAARLGVTAHVDDEGGVLWRHRSDKPPKPKARHEGVCSHHLAMLDVDVPLGSHGRQGLCGFCYAFERETDDETVMAIKRVTGSNLPPKALCRLQQSQARITNADLERVRAGLVLAARQVRRPKRGRKR